MSIKWKTSKKLKPQVVLDKLNAARKQDSGERVHFDAFASQDVFSALLTMIDFGVPLNEIVRRRILNSAIAVAAKDNDLTASRALVELNSQLAEYHNNRETSYSLLTSISFEPPAPISTIELCGCRIRFLSENFPKKYTGRDTISWVASEPHTPRGYSKVVITTKAKSTHEAATL